MQCKPWSEHVCHRASSWTRCGTCRTAPRAWVQKDHRAELASWTIRPDNGQYECQVVHRPYLPGAKYRGTTVDILLCTAAASAGLQWGHVGRRTGA